MRSFWKSPLNSYRWYLSRIATTGSLDYFWDITITKVWDSTAPLHTNISFQFNHGLDKIAPALRATDLLTNLPELHVEARQLREQATKATEQAQRIERVIEAIEALRDRPERPASSFARRSASRKQLTRRPQ